MVVEFCWSVVTIVALKTMFPASFLPSLANPMVDTHPMNLPGISFNEADGKVLLVSQPVAGRPTVDSAALHALLFEHGFGDCQLDTAAITSAAKPSARAPRWAIASGDSSSNVRTRRVHEGRSSEWK